MIKHLTEIEPYAVRTREAGHRGGHGKTKTFELIKSGEYESYLDGGIRMITTESIRRRIHRKLGIFRTVRNPSFAASIAPDLGGSCRDEPPPPPKLADRPARQSPLAKFL